MPPVRLHKATIWPLNGSHKTILSRVGQYHFRSFKSPAFGHMYPHQPSSKNHQRQWLSTSMTVSSRCGHGAEAAFPPATASLPANQWLHFFKCWSCRKKTGTSRDRHVFLSQLRYIGQIQSFFQGDASVWNKPSSSSTPDVANFKNGRWGSRNCPQVAGNQGL